VEARKRMGEEPLHADAFGASVEAGRKSSKTMGEGGRKRSTAGVTERVAKDKAKRV